MLRAPFSRAAPLNDDTASRRSKISCMKRTMIAALLLTTVLTGCGNSDEASEIPNTTETTTHSEASSTSSSAISSTHESSDPETTPIPEPASVEEPTVVECLAGTPGPARWSDGNVSYSEWCFNQMGGAAYMEEENPAEAPQGAAVTGYGTAPNGARNPSSGELQTQWGCQQGYIDDPALCDAVDEVIRSADPEGEIYQ